MTSQHDYIEKQLDSLEAASRPRKDELDRLKELKKIISAEEKEVNRLTDGSKQLKEKVRQKLLYFIIPVQAEGYLQVLHLFLFLEVAGWVLNKFVSLLYP